MSDTEPIQEAEAITQESESKIESPFYPEISSNRLYFHGTGNKERRDSILSNGLRPPTQAVSHDTLSRRISFTDFERYSGPSGFIIGIKPEEDEIDDIKPQYARQVRISPYLECLPPERNVFYLPGSTELTRGIFHQIRQGVGEYFESGFNDKLLLSKLDQMVTYMEDGLKRDATIIDTNNHVDVHRLAQQIVWNELCGYATIQNDEMLYDARIIAEVRDEKNILTLDQLISSIKEKSSYTNFDLKTYLDNLRFLSNIGDIKGLGFDGLNYYMIDHLQEVANRLEGLPSDNQVLKQTEDVGKKSRIGQLISQLRSIGKAKPQKPLI